MVPSTIGALVIFLLLVTPGIAFELLWQRTRPRRDESVFVEISRVLLTGVLFSAAAAVTLAALAAVVPGAALDAVVLLRDGAEHLRQQAALALRTVAALVILALCYAVVVHDLLTAPPSRRITPGTLWHTALGRMAPAGVRVFLSVQLRDGTTITGYSAGYSTEPDPGKRDLLLAAPLAIRRPGAARSSSLDTSWQVMVVSGADVSTIAAAYVGAALPPAAPAWWRRWATWPARHARPAALATAGVVLVGMLVTALAGR